MTLNFAVLAYGSSPLLEASGELAAFVVAIDENGAPVRTRLLVAPDWRSSVPKSDESYIESVLEDLGQIELEDALGVFEQISSMSVGTLRTGRTGQCTEAQAGEILRSSVAQAS